MTSITHEMPQGKSWRARLIKWYRKTFNRPRIYKTIATGEGQDKVAWTSIKNSPEGVTTILDHGIYDEVTDANGKREYKRISLKHQAPPRPPKDWAEQQQTPAGDVSMPKRKVGTLEARLEALQVT